MLVGLMVGVARQIVIHAGGHVAPMRGRKRSAGRGFEVRRIKGVLRTGEDFVQRVCLPGPRGQGSEQRAGGEKLEKIAPVPKLLRWVWQRRLRGHDCSFYYFPWARGAF